MNMKKALVALVSAFWACSGAFAQTNQLFDEGWQFTNNGKTISVDLPHDWDIFTAPDPEKGATGTGGGWYAAGKGEYRKGFKTPAGELVKLHFEGVYQKAEVFVNGQKAGQHAYGYTPFTVDVTPLLYRDKRMNEVVVKVNNSEQPNCRWYSGSGIYRHVWLQTMPALHIAENGVFVTTPEVSDNQALVQVEVSVANESPSNRNAIITIGGKELTVNLAAGETQTVRTQFTVNNPSLWSTEHPTLNNLSVQLKEKGKILDTQTVKYGIRSFSFDAEKGFILNGKKVLINGACVHHDDGVLGASAFDGWRTQKNPYDYSTVIDSCFRSDIQSMVLRDRNHPSIISWSIGNEVIERKDIRVVYTARQMKAAIHEKDTTRPVTEALCAWDSDWEIYDPHAEVLDVVGYNYMLFKHADDHKRDPKRVIWQTESYPRDAFRNWATVHDFPYVVGDIVWTGLDYLGESGIGRTYYKGEREGESWIKGGQPEWHGAPCGDVDITGWRKPISHYREMLWNENTPLYMAVKEPEGYHGEIKQTMWSVWPTYESWTWKGWEGKPVEVEVYTHQPKVKLYLNDQLIGTKEVNRNTEYKAVFTVPYQKGTLRAEAGEESVTLKTAGEPARLKLTPDRTVMRADGQSLTYIIVEVVDQDGNLVPEAEIPCEATVKGAGKLLAFASANLKDEEPYPSVHSKTWKGRAMLVVRSSQKKGTVNVSIKSKLPIATLSLKTK